MDIQQRADLLARTELFREVEPSVLLAVTRDDLLRLLRSEDKVPEALLRGLGIIVRRTTRQVSDLAFFSLQGRVAAKLLDLVEPAQDRTRPITQDELARMVGGARQTVNQVLRSLQMRGYTLADGRAIEILDMALASTTLAPSHAPGRRFALGYGMVFVVLLLPTRL